MILHERDINNTSTTNEVHDVTLQKDNETFVSPNSISSSLTINSSSSSKILHHQRANTAAATTIMNKYHASPSLENAMMPYYSKGKNDEQPSFLSSSSLTLCTKRHDEAYPSSRITCSSSSTKEPFMHCSLDEYNVVNSPLSKKVMSDNDLIVTAINNNNSSPNKTKLFCCQNDDDNKKVLMTNTSLCRDDNTLSFPFIDNDGHDNENILLSRQQSRNNNNDLILDISAWNNNSDKQNPSSNEEIVSNDDDNNNVLSSEGDDEERYYLINDNNPYDIHRLEHDIKKKQSSFLLSAAEKEKESNTMFYNASIDLNNSLQQLRTKRRIFDESRCHNHTNVVVFGRTQQKSNTELGPSIR